jgi:condensin-2 complex subunit G2
MAAGNAGNKSNEAAAAAAAATTTTTTFSKADLQLAIQALADSIGTTNHIEDFVALFDPSTSAAGSSNNVAKTIKNGLSVKEQRKLLHAALQQTTAKSSAGAVPILDTFFARLLTVVQTAIQQQDFIPESAFVEGEKDDDDDIRIGGDQDAAPVNVTVDDHARRHLHLLQHAAFCVTARLAATTRTSSSRSSSSSSSSSFGVDSSEWKLSVALHEALHDIDPGWGHDASVASAAIVALCETHWLSKRTGREQVILHALPFLVEGALQSKPELKRLYTVREALTVIDFDSDESKPFASLLLRLVSIPSCLKAVEGKKLLSYLLRIGLCRPLHRSIRAQIPGNKASILHDYGDIYHQAWKEAADDDEQREVIELEIYQDLVYALVHAAKPPLVQSLLLVLEPLHQHQNNADVEALLYRMYGPLLWRALSAANERVRANAVQVLGRVFPLRAPPAEAKKSGSGGTNPLERALTALESALQDEAPLVRSEASTATAMVLTNFWDVIPPRDIRKFLNCTSNNVCALPPPIYLTIHFLYLPQCSL